MSGTDYHDFCLNCSWIKQPRFKLDCSCRHRLYYLTFLNRSILKSAFAGDEVRMNVNTRLFYGDYEINQLDADGNILGTDTFTLASNQICSFDSLNMLVDGEFDDMSAWAVTGANSANLHPYKITRFGAYEINSLLISRSEEEGADFR